MELSWRQQRRTKVMEWVINRIESVRWSIVSPEWEPDYRAPSSTAAEPHPSALCSPVDGNRITSSHFSITWCCEWLLGCFQVSRWKVNSHYVSMLCNMCMYDPDKSSYGTSQSIYSTHTHILYVTYIPLSIATVTKKSHCLGIIGYSRIFII